MKYPDGRDVLPGDRIDLGGGLVGTVVACMDENRYADGYEIFAYLSTGIMVKTEEAGLVHCPKPSPRYTLLRRKHE